MVQMFLIEKYQKQLKLNKEEVEYIRNFKVNFSVNARFWDFERNIESISARLKSKYKNINIKEENKLFRAREREREKQISAYKKDYNEILNGIFIPAVLNLGTYYTLDVRYGSNNTISCKEEYEKYAHSKYFKTIRHFYLTIKKGYHLKVIGGLLTIFKGKYNRKGMKCSWVVQGRTYSDIKLVSGFIVKEEHLTCSTLETARKLNAKHREEMLGNALSARRKRNKLVNGGVMVNIEDSVRAGNCRAGSLRFKAMYEKEIGHEANEISISDLIKYGKKFKMEMFTNRVIMYIMNKNKCCYKKVC